MTIGLIILGIGLGVIGTVAYFAWAMWKEFTKSNR